MNVWQEIKKAAIDATADHATIAGGMIGAVGAIDNWVTGHYSTIMVSAAFLSIIFGRMAVKAKNNHAKERLAFDKEVFEYQKAQDVK